MVVITFVTPVVTFVTFFGVCFFDDFIPKNKKKLYLTRKCCFVKSFVFFLKSSKPPKMR